MSREVIMISGVSCLLLVLLGASGIFLYQSPSVGIGTKWDESAGGWRVESVDPWSVLQKGDLIKSIGGIPIDNSLFLGCAKDLENREKVLSWYERRSLLYGLLKAGEVPFTVVRGSGEISLVLTPKPAGWSFLQGLDYWPLLAGLFCFAVGVVVLHKKGLDEQSVTLFLLCSFYFLTGICFVASISHELVLAPPFGYLCNALNAVGITVSGVLILHLALILPARKKLMDRFPRLLWPAYLVAVPIGASLEIQAIHVMMSISLVLALLSLGHSFLTCRTPIQRQQLKWLAAGFVFGLAPFLGLAMLPLVLTGQELVSVGVTGLGLPLVFLSIGFAIQKYRLMEIDAFLEGTLVYAITLTLLGIVDLSVMRLFSTRLGQAFEVSPTGKLFFLFAITISCYAAIRDWIRICVRKALGREPLKEQDILLAFTEAASGRPPASILRLLASSIKDALKPMVVTLVERGNGANEELLSAFRGMTAPTQLWQSPLQQKIPDGASYYLALPVSRDGETECVVLLGELPGGRFYSTREVIVLRALLREAKLLYENAWLYDENLKNCRLLIEEEKRHLQEKEKILRELHDGLGGITSNISLLSEMALKASTLSATKASLATISDLSREGLTEIRAFMHSLDDENLTWPGLASDIRSYGTKIIEANGMTFGLEACLDDVAGKPGRHLLLNLFRIYREALTNIVKHSGATRVRVRLQTNPEKVLLAVEDNGAGFEEDQAKKGRGLAHMRKRAADVGGILSIQSDQGTRVQLEVKL